VCQCSCGNFKLLVTSSHNYNIIGIEKANFVRKSACVLLYNKFKGVNETNMIITNMSNCNNNCNSDYIFYEQEKQRIINSIPNNSEYELLLAEVVEDLEV
jgi:hypothetical protein